MEKTPAPQAENHAPNTSGAVVPINDLFIDLRFLPDVSVTVENCPHNFTMIGFISQMRTRNPGASNPFPGRDLPPLPVQNRPRRCPVCLTNDGASTSAPTPYNISTTLNEVSGDDAVVPIETPESPTPLAIDEEMVPNACNADAEMVPVEAVANTDCDVVRDDRAAEMNTGNNVRDDEAIEMNTNSHVRDDQTTEMNTDTAVRDDQAMEMNTDRDVRDLQEIATITTDSGVRNHQENVDAGEMDVEGNGTDDENDDFRTLRELQQARSLRRLPRVGNMNSVVVPETVESVPPVEVEEMNITMSIDDHNLQQVSSSTSSPKKAKKTRSLTDVLHDTESKKTFYWMEDDSAYWSRPVDSSGANPSLINGFGPSANRTRTKRRTRQEGEGSSSRRPPAEKSNDAEPSFKRSKASTSRGRASAPSGLGLQLGNKADRLKRKAAKNPSLVTKKTKSVPLRISEPHVRSGGSSTMSVSNSLRSPSEVAGPRNIFSNNHSLQIPDSTTIVPQPSEQNLVRRTQLLDLNESVPTEKDIVMEKENEGPSERRDDNDTVEGFPMDIVELMARNQFERTLGNTSSQSIVPSRLLDLHNNRNAERPAVGSSGLNGILFRNPRDGMNIPTTNNGAGRNHFNMVQADSGRQFSAVAARTIPQRGVVLQPSSSVMPFTPNSVLPQFSSEPSPATRPRGITISDIKADELRRTGEARPVPSGSGTIELNNNREGPSSDHYTSDHIPAMQLLSLMNGNSTYGGTSSRSRNRFLDNDAITPPGFHPNSSQNRRTGFTNEHFCSINRNPAEFSTPEEGNEFTIHRDDIRIRNSRSAGASGSNSQWKGKGIAGQEKRANNDP